MASTALPAVCLGLWLSEDGTRAMRITATPDGVRVSVWRCADRAALHLDQRPAKWHPPKPDAATSAHARDRVGYLQVEVGHPGLGSTYDLMVTTRNLDPSTFGGFDWRPIMADTPRAEVRLFPEGGASYYEAVLGYYDDVVEAIRDADDWMQPLSTWLPAVLASVDLRAALGAGEHHTVLAALSDLAWLEARCAASFSTLLDELAWVLRGAPRPLPPGAHLDHPSGAHLERGALLLLEAVVQASAEELARHPGRLFEVVYNTLYWHDAPARAAHHDGTLAAPTGGPGCAPPACLPTGAAIWCWMEHWRATFEARPGAAWLRRLRPPPEGPLPSWRVGQGAAQLSPDGRTLLLRRPVPGYTSSTHADGSAGPHTHLASQPRLRPAARAWRLGERCPAPEGERFVRYIAERAQLWSNVGLTPLCDLEPHRGAIRRAVFVGQGRLLLTASAREVHAVRGADGVGVASWAGGAGDEDLEAMPCDDGLVLLHRPQGALLWDLSNEPSPTGMTGPPPEAWTRREGKVQAAYRLNTGVYPPGRAYPAELRCLDAGTGAARMTLVSPEGINGRVSPDGACLLTYTGKHARLWAADSLAPLWVLGPHPETIRSVAFSGDGSVVVLASFRELRAFGVADGAALGALGAESVTSASGAGAGPFAARALPLQVSDLQPCGEGRVLFHSEGWRLWDFVHPPTLASQPTGSHAYSAVSPTGHRLVQYRQGEGLEGWALPAGELLFRQKAAQAYPLAFHPGGRLFAVAGDYGRIELRDATTGEPTETIAIGKRGAPSWLGFDPTGRFLLICHEGDWALWALAAAQVVARARTGRFYGNHATWSRDGRTFAFGDWEGTRMADLTELAPAVRWRDDARPPDRDYPRLHFSPSGETLVLRHGDGIAFWEVAGGVLKRFVEAKLVAFFAQGGRVLGRRGGALLAFDSEDGAELWEVPLPPADFENVEVADGEGLLLHDDRKGTLVALGQDDGRERYRLQGLTLVLHSREVFLARSAAGEIGLREVATGAERLLLPMPGGADRFALSPDRRWLAAWTDKVLVWDLTAGTVRHTFEPGWGGSGLTFRADGALVISTCVSPQSGNTDSCSESVYDPATGACIDSSSWDEPSYATDDTPREVAEGVLQVGALLRVGGVDLPLPSRALARGTPSGVFVASTSTGRVELYQLCRTLP